MTERWACPRHPDRLVRFNGGRLWCQVCKRELPDAIKVVTVPEADWRGAVEALREAIEAARLFNRSGMTWSEYDALLARLEHDHLGGQSQPSSATKSTMRRTT